MTSTPPLRTGNGLYYGFMVLAAIWLLPLSFIDPPIWFHLFGVGAGVLFAVRLAKGDN